MAQKPAQTLTIVVEFANVLTPQATREVQEALTDFKSALYLGRVVKAELKQEPQAEGSPVNGAT